jgi:hypothetical protein
MHLQIPSLRPPTRTRCTAPHSPTASKPATVTHSLTIVKTFVSQPQIPSPNLATPPPPCTAPHWPTATSAASALATHCLTTSSNLFAACYNSRPLHKASTSLHITVRQSLTATAHMSVLHAAAFALQQPQAPCTRSAPKHANRSQLHTIRALSNPEVYKAVCCNLPLQTPSPRPPIRARCVAPHWPTDTSAASAAKKARWCCCCTTRRHRRLW